MLTRESVIPTPESAVSVAARICSQRQVEVAESKLQELLEFGSVGYSVEIEVQLCFHLQIAAAVFCDMQFMERPSL